MAGVGGPMDDRRPGDSGPDTAGARADVLDSDASPGPVASPGAGGNAAARSIPAVAGGTVVSGGSAARGDTPAGQAGLDALRLVTRDAAHDVDNLLMAASAYAALALQDLAPDSPARDAVERMEFTTRAAAALRRQLLELSGVDPAEAGPSDIAAELAGIDELLRVAAGRGTDLRLELSGSLPPVAVPRRALRRAVVLLVLAGRDLLRNGQGTLALHAVVRGGDRIAIDLSGKGADVAEDAGMDGGGTREDGGVAEGITEDAGRGTGEDGARPEEPAAGGRGDQILAGIAAEIAPYGGLVAEDRARMTLEMVVPVASDAGGEARPWTPGRLPAPRPADTPPVVLIIDDEEAVRRVAGRLLESIGCVVELADGGTAGVERFRVDPCHYDAVLLDLSMPGLAGVDVLKRVREARAEVAVVLMSGYAPEDLTAEVRAQAVTFLQKPFSRASLLEALQDALSTTPGL